MLIAWVQDKTGADARIRALRPRDRPVSAWQADTDGCRARRRQKTGRERNRMKDLACGLKDSQTYCKIFPGRCCRSCHLRTSCDKACMNTPSRCGQAREKAPV